MIVLTVIETMMVTYKAMLYTEKYPKYLDYL